MHERATQGGIFGSSEVGPGTWYAVWWTMREARRAGGSVRDHRRLPMKRKGPWWCGSHRQGAHASHVAFGVGRVDGKGRPQVSLRERSGRAPPRQTFERLSACAFGVAGRTSWGSSLSTLTARTLPQAAAMTSDWSADRPFARPCPKHQPLVMLALADLFRRDAKRHHVLLDQRVRAHEEHASRHGCRKGLQKACVHGVQHGPEPLTCPHTVSRMRGGREEA